MRSFHSCLSAEHLALEVTLVHRLELIGFLGEIDPDNSRVRNLSCVTGVRFIGSLVPCAIVTITSKLLLLSVVRPSLSLDNAFKQLRR